MSELKEEIRLCNNRNCGFDISHKRTHAKYCSRSCKSQEHSYMKREDEQMTQEKNQITEMIEMMRGLSDEGIQKLVEMEKIMKRI